VDERRGRVIVTDDYESRVSVLDARRGVVQRTFTAGLDPTGVAIDPNSGHAYVADTSENKVLVLDVARGRVLRALPVAGSPLAVRVDAATGRLYVMEYDANTSVGGLTVLDVRNGRVLMGAGKASSVVVADPRAAALYTVDFATDSVFVTTPRSALARKVVSWGGGDTPATAGAHPATIDPRTGDIFILMDACGQRLTPTVAGCVHVLDPRAGQLVATIPVGRTPTALAIDGVTGRVFVANSRGGSGAAADWAPSWLRDHLSWLLAPRAADGGSTTGTISVFDAPR
ncbi:MAG: YncE family protein, partial [Chloroflexota bacterium]|nr:YncE family protein [Chloroflexota bacterium]